MAFEGDICLVGVECRVRLGVPDWERKKPQKVYLDIALDLLLAKAATSDDVRDTADYAAIEKRVRKAVESGEFRLAERLSAVAANEALSCDRRIRSATVIVHKKPVTMPKTREVSVRFTAKRR